MFGMGQGLTAIVLIVAVVTFFGTIREVTKLTVRLRIAKWNSTACECNDKPKPMGSVVLDQANGEV
jgi:hypothetical protein